MYYYIVDPQKITQREFERVQSQLYSSLSSYKVSGEVVRVTGLRTINQLVENAFSHGVKTLVAVGSDETLHEVINALAGREIVVGFIPITKSEIGETLGMGSIESSAKTLGLRRIETLDLGKVNDIFFVSRLTFGLGSNLNQGLFRLLNLNIIKSLSRLSQINVKFSVNGQYSAEIPVIGGVVINSRPGENNDSDPTDGNIDVLLLPKLSKMKIFRFRKNILRGEFEKIPESSVIHVNKLEILLPEGLPLKLGNKVIAKTPAAIEVVPKAIKIIVGRDRKF